jgi:hypothetical protein
VKPFPDKGLRWDEMWLLLLGVVVAMLLALAGQWALAWVPLLLVFCYGVALKAFPPGSRGRLLAAYAAVWAWYAGFSLVVERAGIPLRQDWLLAADRWCFGHLPAVAMQSWTHPLALDVMSLAYLAYQVYLHWFLWDAWGQTPGTRHAMASWLFPGFAVGMGLYLVCPAAPPGVAFPELFRAPFQGYWITQWNAALNVNMAARYDAFPSLHVLITLLLLAWDWQHRRQRFWLMLPLALLMVPATLTLRLHYAVDLLAAGGLFLLLFFIHVRLAKR